MRTKKRILNKAAAWSNNPMMIAGTYKLFTYVPWADIPEKYKPFFDAKAADIWDTDLETYDEDLVKYDIERQIKAILQILVKKNVTHSVGLLPSILADAYAIGLGTSPFEGKILKIVEEYKEIVDFDRTLAEQYVLIKVVDLMKAIVKKLHYELSFDINHVVELLIKDYAEKAPTKKGAKKKEVDIEAAVTEALKEEHTPKEAEDA